MKNALTFGEPAKLPQGFERSSSHRERLLLCCSKVQPSGALAMALTRKAAQECRSPRRKRDLRIFVFLNLPKPLQSKCDHTPSKLITVNQTFLAPLPPSPAFIILKINKPLPYMDLPIWFLSKKCEFRACFFCSEKSSSSLSSQPPKCHIILLDALNAKPECSSYASLLENHEPRL